MVDVECPIDGCGYSGSVKSVEGHISGATSGEHGGAVGQNYRGDLVEAAKASAEENERNPLGRATDAAPSGKGLVVATVLFLAVALFSSRGEESSEDDGQQPEQEREVWDGA